MRCGRRRSRARRRGYRDRPRRRRFLLAGARYRTRRTETLRTRARRGSGGLGDGRRIRWAWARNAGPRRRRERGTCGRGRRGYRRRTGANRDGGGRRGCAWRDGRRDAGLADGDAVGAGGFGDGAAEGREVGAGEGSTVGGALTATAIGATVGTADRRGRKLRRWGRLEDVLRRLRRRLNALLRNRLRIGGRFRIIAREFVQILRLQLTLRLRQRRVTHRRDAFHVRHWNGRGCGRRLRYFDRRAPFERHDFAAGNVLGGAFLRRTDEHGEEQHCEQRVQDQREDGTARQSLRVPTVERIAPEAHNRAYSALKRAQEPAAAGAQGALRGTDTSKTHEDRRDGWTGLARSRDPALALRLRRERLAPKLFSWNARRTRRGDCDCSRDLRRAQHPNRHPTGSSWSEGTHWKTCRRRGFGNARARRTDSF